jgi:hypothetical protein
VLVGTARSRSIFSCGLFVPHYWDAEVRQFCGEGWYLERPTQKVIEKLWEKLRKVTKELEEFHAKIKKQTEAVEATMDFTVDLSVLPIAPPAVKVVEVLVAQAELAKHQGLVQFFGCPKCRWSRGGCIHWKCNPEKFQKHFAAHPEKYNTSKKHPECKELTMEAVKKVGCKELVGA